MRAVVVVMLACVTSPTLAAVYKCQTGGRTVYQDQPCIHARQIENINGLPPAPAELAKATERAASDRMLAARLKQDRLAEEQALREQRLREQAQLRTQNPVVTRTVYVPVPVLSQRHRPDRYYDRPDRFRQHRDQHSGARQKRY